MSTSNPLAPIDPTALVATRDVAETFLRSGYFQTIKSADQAIVKIMAGAELGIGPFAAMRHVHIWQGQIQVGYQLIGSAIKRHPSYDYRVKESTRERAAIEFLQVSRTGDGYFVLGLSEYTMEDARAAGLASKDNWRKHPRTMLLARALSNGCNIYCPDVMGGAVYSDGDDLDGFEPGGRGGGGGAGPQGGDGDDGPKTIDVPPGASRAAQAAAALGAKAEPQTNGGAPQGARKAASGARKTAPKGDDRAQSEPDAEFAAWRKAAREVIPDDAELIDQTRRVLRDLGFERDAIDFGAKTMSLPKADAEVVLLQLEAVKG